MYLPFNTILSDRFTRTFINPSQHHLPPVHSDTINLLSHLTTVISQDALVESLLVFVEDAGVVLSLTAELLSNASSWMSANAPACLTLRTLPLSTFRRERRKNKANG